MTSPVSRSASHTLLLLLILLVSSISDLKAQNRFSEYDFNTTDTYKVVLNDGSEFIGKFVSSTDSVLVLRTKSIPKIEIPFSNIKSINIVDAQNLRKDGSYWFPNPNPTRYFFTTSAINLERGSGYYQNSYLVINAVNYGITDFFSIGGGFELTSTFSPDVNPFFFLTPKIGIKTTDKFYVGGGLLIGNADGYTIGTTYGMATYGDNDDNITAGLGWGFFEGEFAPEPVIMLAGMTRVSRRISLVSDNLFFPNDDGYYEIISYGVRFFGEKLAVDLGFINNSDIFEFLPIGVPYVDFVVKF